MLLRQEKAKHGPNPINFHIHHVPKPLALLVFTFYFLIIVGESRFSSCLPENLHSLLCFAKLVYIFSHLFWKMDLPKAPPEAAVFAHVFLSPESAPALCRVWNPFTCPAGGDVPSQSPARLILCLQEPLWLKCRQLMLWIHLKLNSLPWGEITKF